MKQISLNTANYTCFSWIRNKISRLFGRLQSTPATLPRAEVRPLVVHTDRNIFDGATIKASLQFSSTSHSEKIQSETAAQLPKFLP